MPRGSRALTAVLVLVFSSSPLLATTVSGILTGAKHWTLLDSPYQLTGDTTVPAGSSLTIDPGVVIVASSPCALTVAGSLSIAATSANPVTFGPAPGLLPGEWQGLRLSAGASATVAGAVFSGAATNVSVDAATASFSDCTFAGAVQDGVLVANASQVTAEGCTFSGNGRRGLYVETTYPRGSVTNCVFADNGEYPIWAKANCLDMLGAGLEFYRNGHQQLAVNCSASTDILRTQTWHSQPVPLNLTPGSTKGLVVPAGIVLTLTGPLNVICRRVDVAGALRLGQPGGGTVALNGGGAPGCWEGIHVSATGLLTLEGARVTQATTGITGEGAIVTLKGARIAYCQFDALALSGNCSLTATASFIVGNGRYGFYLPGSVSGSVSNTSFKQNGDYPVYALARNIGILGKGNGYAENGKAAIGVACALDVDVPVSASWNNPLVPFDLTANPAGTVLNIGPRANLILGQGITFWGGGVEVRGRLEALANQKRKVSFLPPGGGTAPGSWAGLLFQPGSSGRLRWCRVYYAQTAVTVQDASPRLEYSEFRFSSGVGVSCAGAAAPILSHCRISGNGGYGVWARDTSRPNLGDLGNEITYDDGGNTLLGNNTHDLRNESAYPILAQGNWWGTTNLATISSHVWDGSDQVGLGLVTYTPVATVAPTEVLPTLSGPVMTSAYALATGRGWVEVRCHLLLPASLSLRVMNMAGRTVGELPPQPVAEVGERVLLWPTRTTGGQRLPAGPYLLELSAFSPDGGLSRQLLPLTLP